MSYRKGRNMHAELLFYAKETKRRRKDKDKDNRAFHPSCRNMK